MAAQFQPKLEERCLGQITRVQIKPVITTDRGNCTECKYNVENKKCKAYTSVVVRFFEVVEYKENSGKQAI